MRVSVVTWDASFRENLHTIDSFGRQIGNDAELIWIEFYNTDENVDCRLQRYKNCHSISLNYDVGTPWHLGKCINSGVKASSGEILIIPDGDIIVPPGFIDHIVSELESNEEVVLYHRRFDEPRRGKFDEIDISIESLEQRCKLSNPTNYAGCLALRRSLFDKINGFEEHWAFAGPGVSGMEAYVRLRNYGSLIKWCSEKVYHPWHESTGRSSSDFDEMITLKNLAAKYHWIMPYAGIAQSWIVQQRALSLSTESSISECEMLLSKLPDELVAYVKKNV